MQSSHSLASPKYDVQALLGHAHDTFDDTQRATTTEYHKTKEILHVMQLLGHGSIKNTLLYTQLMKNVPDDDFV